MIDKETAQKIKDTADIVDVVSDYVHLIRRGANYMGLCPFHNERTPSFSVNKANNFCYCFSCHKGGSPISFIMEKEGISYHDALLQLARKYGIKVEERELTDEERELQSRKESLFVANEWAMNFFHDKLLNSEEGQQIGLNYFYGRGVTQEAIKHFKLGYAPDRNNLLLEEAKKKGFNVDVLIRLGLIGTSQNGQLYDRFRGRIMFPFMNSSGKIIAFGGRDLKGGLAKYINSPETEIYKKSNELYGMFQARSSIVKEDRCILVEGYLDVIGFWQVGIKNVVASSGTALTDGQISLIHRFTNNITLVYDGDPAGIKASLRGIDMLLSHQMDVKVLLLPEGDDPDSFARKHSPDEVKKYIEENETDIINFKIKVLSREANNDPQKRRQVINSVINSIAHIPDKITREIYVQECCRLLNIPEESIGPSLRKAREAVMQEEKRNRNRRDLAVSEQDENIDNLVKDPFQDSKAQLVSQSPSNTSDGTDSDRIEGDSPKVQDYNNNPLKKLEWKILEYCLRFPFVKLWDQQDETSGEIVPVTTIEYVAEEMMIDNLSFTYPDFSFTFDEIKSKLPEFKKQLSEYREDIEAECQRIRLARYDEIRQKNLSMKDIEREESKLEKELEIRRREKEFEFSKSFSIREFTSHENDIIRNLANYAMRERPKLSRIYTKDGIKDTEEDRLVSLILTALNVWKNGILDLELKKLLALYQEKTLKGNVEEIQEVQLQLKELFNIRSNMAKNIGDRTVAPRKRGM